MSNSEFQKVLDRYQELAVSDAQDNQEFLRSLKGTPLSRDSLIPIIQAVCQDLDQSELPPIETVTKIGYMITMLLSVTK